MANIGDKIILTAEGLELLNENDLRKIYTKNIREFTVESLMPIPITDGKGNNRRMVNEAYTLELPDVNIGLENIHWKIAEFI